MAFQIPKSERAHFAQLVSATPELLDSIFSILNSETSPSLTRNGLAFNLYERLGNRSGVTLSQLRSIVRVLLDLHRVLADSNIRPERFAQEIAEAAQHVSDDAIRPPEGGWPNFVERLTKLLSLDRAMGVAAKAALLAGQIERHFHDCRLLTDARPVYPPNSTEAPAAFLVMHTLQIDYCENGDDKEWFLSLGSDDLQALKESVERAIEKEESLRKLLKKTEVPVVDWKETQDGDAGIR